MTSTIKKAFLSASIALISLNAQATLTSYNPNGVELVYSSVSNVTWTKDANLLGSMFDSRGFNTVINDILSVSPTITNIPNDFSPSGTYTISSNDFYIDGAVTWFGAMAFMNYLNHINYGGSNQWFLPTVSTTTVGYDTANNGIAPGDELKELYYTELDNIPYYEGGLVYGIQDPSNYFDNEEAFVYWTSTEYVPDPKQVWRFVTLFGTQDYDRKGLDKLYAWAITPGVIQAVPEPENLTMLLAGLGLLGVAVRRNRIA